MREFKQKKLKIILGIQRTGLLTTTLPFSFPAVSSVKLN